MKTMWTSGNNTQYISSLVPRHSGYETQEPNYLGTLPSRQKLHTQGYAYHPMYQLSVVIAALSGLS